MYISDKFPWRHAVHPNRLRPRLLPRRHCLFALWRYLRIAYTVSYNGRTISDRNPTRLLLHITSLQNKFHFNIYCEHLLTGNSTSQHLGKCQEIVIFNFYAFLVVSQAVVLRVNLMCFDVAVKISEAEAFRIFFFSFIYKKTKHHI